MNTIISDDQDIDSNYISHESSEIVLRIQSEKAMANKIHHQISNQISLLV